MHPQSTLTTPARQTREQLMCSMLTNVRGEEAQRAFLSDPRVMLSFNVAYESGARANRCGHNAEDGYDFLRDRTSDVLDIVHGFMVIHEYWNIRVIEHSWLLLGEGENAMIVDPTLPFLLVGRLPTYFQGAVDDPTRPYPDLRNRQYKAAFQAAKQFAETCDYVNMSTHTRRIHIGRMNWVEGLWAAEGRVSR